MNKIELNHLDTTIYHERLENGLEIFVAPNHHGNNVYATYSTKLGSVYNEFVPFGKKEFVKVPDGVAHFLEHKVFEQEDGSDPFEFFTSHGASANANTSNYKTTYLFQGTKDITENLKYLLHYVEHPYFTDENVEKEKGIIKQELLMYDDDPYWKLYETTLFNSFQKHPIRYSVGGTVQSIQKITKDILYECYNTFYHPRNMFLVVTGDVEPEEIISLVREEQSHRETKEMDAVKIKLVDEPDTVYKEQEDLYMDITIPKVTVAYKINMEQLQNITERDFKKYLNICLDLKFGETSQVVEELKEQNIITESFGYDVIYTNRHALIMISTETKNTKEVILKIDEMIHHLSCTEEELERAKKVIISNNIYMTDHIYSMNHKIMSDMIREGKVMDHVVDEIKRLNIQDLEQLIKQLDFSNKTITTVKEKEKH